MYPNPFYLFVILSFMLNYVTGLYFHLGEGERKCFIEEVPSDTMVTSKFNVNTIPIKYLKINFLSDSFAAHYKIELYDSRSGGFAPPSLGKKSTTSIVRKTKKKSSFFQSIISKNFKYNFRHWNAC